MIALLGIVDEPRALERLDVEVALTRVGLEHCDQELRQTRHRRAVLVNVGGSALIRRTDN